MDGSAIFRMDVGFHKWTMCWNPLECAEETCPLGLPEILTGAQMTEFSCQKVSIYPCYGNLNLLLHAQRVEELVILHIHMPQSSDIATL